MNDKSLGDQTDVNGGNKAGDEGDFLYGADLSLTQKYLLKR